ncbi:sugar ABC transporter ATP-binding protein [Fontivita pretiosa]|uniref:sugar ABC transporter ATP-binding protein n=1 Tax=Fontivita pretiosa TaxID=2989684 RepID=UPI003D1684B4
MAEPITTTTAAAPGTDLPGAHPTDAPPARLRMRGIEKRFGATVALASVDLDVQAGQVLALVGENGAGKSTLMKVLSGAHQPDAGQMWLDGQPYKPRHPLDARMAGVAMIYQELSLARHLSVMENILLGMEPTRGPLVRWSEVRALAANALGILGRSDIPLNIPVGRLSVAEQQLVEIARAVAIGCRVLVLDEPTSSLGARDIQRLFELVRRLKSQGQAIVYISHFLEEVKAISDRFTVLRDGRSVGGGATADATHDQIIQLMVGRRVEDLYPRSPRSRGEVILQIDDLAGTRKPVSASLSLHRGEVLGIAGLVGAGRTELLRAIFGLDAVRRGQIRVAAYQGPASPARRWEQGVGMVSEDRKNEGLALGLSIADNVTLSSLPMLLSPAAQDRATQGWIARLAIRCRHPRQPVQSLSGGNQQKVALARLLHHDVDVLLLDEPTRGIDVGSKAQIYKVIDELACRGRAVLMVSSYLPELLGVCDRIAVMCKGRLGPARPVEQCDEHQIMLEATGAETEDHAGA